MASISASYDILNNPRRRAEYGARLNAQAYEASVKENYEEKLEDNIPLEDDDFLYDFQSEEYEYIWKIYENHLLSISKFARIFVVFFVIFYVIS